MGPYCRFCDRRCFVFFPDNTPEHILAAYGTSNIIATCPGGQEFEKTKVGYCYDDIVTLTQPDPAPLIRDGVTPSAESLAESEQSRLMMERKFLRGGVE